MEEEFEQQSPPAVQQCRCWCLVIVLLVAAIEFFVMWSIFKGQ